MSLLLFGGCASPARQRARADETAARIIRQKQKEALGNEEPFTVERPSDTLRRRLLLDQGLPHAGADSLGTDRLTPPPHWPEQGPAPEPPPDQDEASGALPPWEGPGPLVLSLVDALQVGARNSREYQATKEGVFLAALDLDLERNGFRTLFSGGADGDVTADLSGPDAPDGVTGSASAGATRLLRNGLAFAATVGLDLVRLLTGSRASSLGLFGDASITMPLLRGGGRDVVEEPLRQAERNVVYALRNFDRFKRTFAVRVASEYLDVLRLLDGVANAEENYRNLILLSRRTAALDEAGRISGVEVDQARQDELRARDRWIAARQSYEGRLDAFKTTLGLPPDARIELGREELATMTTAVREILGLDHGEGAGGPVASSADEPIVLREPNREEGGPFEQDENRLIRLALLHRQDLRVARGRVEDAQRAVVVAADALRAGLDLVGTASAGGGRGLSSAESPNADLRPSKGVYSAGLSLDLPLERTAERNAYREGYVALEGSVRDLQELEDRIKTQVRDGLRALERAREGVRIQGQAVKLARNRVESTNLFLEAGRAQVRDVLEATEALIGAQNSLTEALVNYRVAELELQRDLDVLDVNEKGLWTEYGPERIDEDLAHEDA